MEHKCPKCGSVIYSRRNVLCGACGERLPDELLFTAEEREKVERDLAEAKRRAREAAKHTPPVRDTGTDNFPGVGGADVGGVS